MRVVTGACIESTDTRTWIPSCWASRPVQAARNPRASAQGLGRGESAALLTLRELDILELMGQSMPNRRIASALGLSIQTVKWNIKNMFGNLGVSSTYDAIAWARKHGVSPDSGGGREP